jgi:hypothetical protein
MKVYPGKMLTFGGEIAGRLFAAQNKHNSIRNWIFHVKKFIAVLSQTLLTIQVKTTNEQGYKHWFPS